VGKTLERKRLRTPVGARTGRGARAAVLVSGAALAVQVSVTDYGAGQDGAGVLWFAIGCVLLWMVASRRSRAARGFVVVTSLVGAALHALYALEDGRHAFVAAAYVLQAVPLMSRQVREHVRAQRP